MISGYILLYKHLDNWLAGWDPVPSSSNWNNSPAKNQVLQPRAKVCTCKRLSPCRHLLLIDTHYIKIKIIQIWEAIFSNSGEKNPLPTKHSQLLPPHLLPPAPRSLNFVKRMVLLESIRAATCTEESTTAEFRPF